MKKKYINKNKDATFIWKRINEYSNTPPSNDFATHRGFSFIFLIYCYILYKCAYYVLCIILK